jgi:predicted dinucleotide-binding enzyme
MKITVFGKGKVGGGLANLWEAAGHKVTRLGRNGGDVGDADVVLIAVPGNAIAEAVGKLNGIKGKTVIDATNLSASSRRPAPSPILNSSNQKLADPRRRRSTSILPRSTGA